MGPILLMEFLGTFFLMLSALIARDPVSVGFMLVGLVYLGRHISGAHFNPAVSFAFFLQGFLKPIEFAYYCGAQLAGAAAAAIYISMIMRRPTPFMPMRGVDPWFVLGTEIILSMALCWVVLTVLTHPRFKGSFVYGAAIGLTFTALASLASKLSGGPLNPAIAGIPAAWNFLMGAQAGAQGGMPPVPLVGQMIYVAGPLIGGALASLVYGMLKKIDNK